MDGSENVEFQLTVSIPDGTEDEIDRLTRGLLNDLKGMDVESARLASDGIAPEGSKGIDPVTTGTIALAVLPTMMPKILEFLQSWSLQGKERTIKFKGKVANQNIDFEGSFAEMEKLVEMLEKKQRDTKKK